MKNGKLEAGDFALVLFAVIAIVTLYIIASMAINETNNDKVYQLGYNDYPDRTYLDKIDVQYGEGYSAQFERHTLVRVGSLEADMYAFGWYDAKHDHGDKTKITPNKIGINAEIANRSNKT
jgi:hypothetical protein